MTNPKPQHPPDPADEEARLFHEGLRLFNRSEWFESHEVWEDIWHMASGDKKRFYQGLIQYAVTIEHIRRGNPRGVRCVYQTTLTKFVGLADVYMGFNIPKQLAQLDRIVKPVLAMGPKAFDPATGRGQPMPVELADAPKITLEYERGTINQNVVAELDKASDPWGVKVLRYEIKNINPPQDVLSAMEKQMRAEREKRAVILTSEGERDARINEAEGEKQQVIKQSEAVKMQQINEAEGEAEAILAIATATAEGLRKVAAAVVGQGGPDAMQLRIAEQYITQFGNLAKAGNTFVVPSNLADLTSMMALATDIAKRKPGGDKPVA